MEKKIRRWFWVWEFDKEEQWLNAMAQSGWVLAHVGYGSFTFSPCEPGEYTVRMEMRGWDEEYLSFVEDTGAEFICRLFQWTYYRRRSELGEFNLFSDLDSRLKHLNRISRTLLGLGCVNLIYGLAITFYPNLNLGWVNLLCAGGLMYALGRIHGKMESMKRDALLIE